MVETRIRSFNSVDPRSIQIKHLPVLVFLLTLYRLNYLMMIQYLFECFDKTSKKLMCILLIFDHVEIPRECLTFKLYPRGSSKDKENRGSISCISFLLSFIIFMIFSSLLPFPFHLNKKNLLISLLIPKICIFKLKSSNLFPICFVSAVVCSHLGNLSTSLNY